MQVPQNFFTKIYAYFIKFLAFLNTKLKSALNIPENQHTKSIKSKTETEVIIFNLIKENAQNTPHPKTEIN